jgi:hypothetical protein
MMRVKKLNCYSIAFFVLAFFLFNTQVFAQTWTIREDENWDCEWRVITREQWNRLIEQKRVQNEYALMFFTDAIEYEETVRVIRGTQPQFRGYYYLLGIISPRIDDARILQNLIGYGQVLAYGNDQTGNFQIIFLNRYGEYLPRAIRVNSSAFTNRFNQCIRWVNGE